MHSIGRTRKGANWPLGVRVCAAQVGRAVHMNEAGRVIWVLEKSVRGGEMKDDIREGKSLCDCSYNSEC